MTAPARFDVAPMGARPIERTRRALADEHDSQRLCLIARR